MTPKRKRRRQDPMTQRDVHHLLEQYKPLIFSIYKKKNYIFKTSYDKEDFISQLHLIFTSLVYEYDPARGVDFPYYIKRMMELRSGHYITKYIKHHQREVTIQHETANFNKDRAQFDELGGAEDFLDEEMLDVLMVESWDDTDLALGDKHENLFKGILGDNKTFKQIAEEEGVSISTLHTRMHFLVKKLREHADRNQSGEYAD